MSPWSTTPTNARDALFHPQRIWSGIQAWITSSCCPDSAATANPERFKKLVLVSAAGVRPPVGEILDIFLITVPILLEASVADKDSVAEFPLICPDEPTPDQVMDWEDVREVACMIGWRPYMHNPNLPHLLHRLKRLPTLLVWGRDDAVIPLSAGQLYNESIPGSRLAVLDNCGHRPEIEMGLEALADMQVTVQFTPHLVPMQRGILSTCSAGLVATGIGDALREAYAAAPFVDVIDQPPQTRWVVGSNRALVHAAEDRHTGRAIVTVAIDNLGKGAAGQAVQCANLALGLPETTGLTAAGWLP